MNCLVLYCRAGFEKECAAEVAERAAALGVPGYVKAKPDSAYAVFHPHDAAAMPLLARRLRFDSLIFARQMLFSAGLMADLPLTDRVTPLLAAARELAGGFSDIFIETADTSEAKELLGFCRSLSRPFLLAARRFGLVAEPPDPFAPRLHVFFLGSAAAYVGMTQPDNASPWFMGIPRLKFPARAPSRSTQKLAEAFLVFLGEAERAQRLRPGMRAVDLGAAPGGWSWQLVHRGMRVTAVDNGPLKPVLLESGLVEHLRQDGFRYRPSRPVDWLVCDMVEQPARIAALVAEWVGSGLARECIFNLKLPMKKRYEEVKRCQGIITDALDAAGVSHALKLKQLYHDRAEVTGYLRRTGK